MSRCSDLALSLANQNGLRLSEKEAKSFVKEFDGQIKRRRIMGPDEVKSAFEVASRKTIEMRLAARQAKREALLRTIKRKEINERIDEYTGKNVANAYRTQLLGEARMEKGSRDSVSMSISGLERNFTGALLRGLSDEGEHLVDILRKGTLDEEIIRFAYDRKAKVSEEAEIIHNVIFKHANAQRERKNRAGAFIGEREDFVTTQQHDPQLIRKAGYEKWRSDILQFLDQEESFKFFANETEQEEYLENLYKRFITGKHYLVDDAGEALVGRPSSFNLAKKISQARKLHFKDGKSAFEYASKYTRGNIWDKLFDAARFDARTVVLLEKFGPNPKAMHDTIVTDIERKAFEKGEVVSKRALDSQFDIVNGSLDIPANVTLAHIAHGARALENMTKLGGAVISAFSDVVFKGATLNRRTDMGFFGSYSKAFTGLLDSVPKSDKKHVANMTSIYTEAVLGRTFARAGAIDGMPGTVSKLQELFFRWSLLQGWTVSHKEGVATAMSFDLARYRSTNFDKLPPNTRRNLELYNITADEWSVVRNMETVNPETGNHFVTPGAVLTLEDSAIDAVISKQFDTLDVTDNMRSQFKDTLSTKFQTLIHDTADEAVVTPSDRERLLLTGGHQKGTVMGEFLRFVTQFKSFPVTVVTKQLAPAYYAAGGGAKGYAALVPIILMATAFGYLTGAAKDVVKCRQPKDPRGAKVWADAFTRGGGAGIFGDFLFQEYSKYGRSLEQTIAGPAIGTVSDLVTLTDGLIRGNKDTGDVIRFAKSVTPGSNLFYLEQAMNYMLFYGAMEWAEPGYLRRITNQRRRDYDQEYWLPPSSAF